MFLGNIFDHLESTIIGSNFLNYSNIYGAIIAHLSNDG